MPPAFHEHDYRFQAFLMYLYTDAIEFAPFGSEDNRKSRSAEIATPSDDKVTRPSPKSIYRLAGKVRSWFSQPVQGILQLTNSHSSMTSQRSRPLL